MKIIVLVININIYVHVGIFESKNDYSVHGTLNIASMWQEALQLNVKHILESLPFTFSLLFSILSD